MTGTQMPKSAREELGILPSISSLPESRPMVHTYRFAVNESAICTHTSIHPYLYTHEHMRYIRGLHCSRIHMYASVRITSYDSPKARLCVDEHGYTLWSGPRVSEERSQSLRSYWSPLRSDSPLTFGTSPPPRAAWPSSPPRPYPRPSASASCLPPPPSCRRLPPNSHKNSKTDKGTAF